MAEQLRVVISWVERQRCAIEFYVRLGKSGSETLQLIHQGYGDGAMGRAAVFKWWKGFTDTNVETSEAPVPPSSWSGKRSAERFREVGGAL
jgi:hypothetical protein